ncbi:unnamed protein product [Arctogadus glacialis]
MLLQGRGIGLVALPFPWATEQEEAPATTTLIFLQMLAFKKADGPLGKSSASCVDLFSPSSPCVDLLSPLQCLLC